MIMDRSYLKTLLFDVYYSMFHLEKCLSGMVWLELKKVSPKTI